MQRKDDHIQHALNQKERINDFDRIRFVPYALPSQNVDTVDTTVTMFNQVFPYPIYINAMTGGTEKAKIINEKLAIIAKTFNLPLASGSLSAAIKKPETADSFTIMRQTYNDGFIIANIGISAPVEYAFTAVKLLDANALQVHINAPQEIIMPEGDRDFSYWQDNLKEMIKTVSVPIIAKEVGFGMSAETLKTLKRLGIEYVDVSGVGGTNFIEIENHRRKHPLNTFDTYGFSTVESLLDAKKVEGLTIFASGGVRNAYDIVKALALGAKMVGLSGYFLKLVSNHNLEEAIEITRELLYDINKLMAILDCNTVDQLKNKPLLFDESLMLFIKQRHIPL
ncbi:MAG: type 2 isopentenyl-diphosphate Delta-isomerase [Candidatus Izemoplasmataceae bacterium]